jgi:hypothetical protein
MLVMLLTGCANEEQVQQEAWQEKSNPVVVDLALSVSNTTNTSSMRMSAADVQATGVYRGISLSRIVPFGVEGKITKEDTPLWYQIGNDKTEYQKTDIFYLYEKCMITPGTASFLTYGRAPKGERTKAVNGSIVETFPLNMAPKDINFGLESIYPQPTTAHATATALASYMTAIATAKANNKEWKNAQNPTLRVIFMNFTHQTESTGGDIMPGSAANVKVLTTKLKETLNTLTLEGDDDAIKTAIITEIDKYNTAWDGFPASIGLPDCAAVLRWSGEGNLFVPQLSNTTVADINGINRFAYPAEVYYYGNSRIRTSNIDGRKDVYNDENNKQWSAVLGEYEYDNGVVTQNTKSIAIKDPMQYGVARMQVRLKQTDYSTLKDADNADVSVGVHNFPLTGVIVGGQLPVGFDFSPVTSYPAYSETDMKFIYDPLVKTNGLADKDYFYLSSTSDATKVTNTLVLQTYDHKKVPIVLEFINTSDKDFKGFDGIVYRGTKFYVVGEVDPEDFKDDSRTEIRDRVFTQDYTTILNLKVTSLAKAYNVLPSLLSPRLEMGIELVPQWVATTPDEVLF